MTNKQKHRPCFVARRPPKQAPVKEWAPLDNEDCDLVYKPSLCMSKMFGKRLLKFEGLLAGVYALHMIDSGASASFISTEFALSHGISCLPVDLAPAQLANNTTVPIDGVTNHLWMRIGPFATKHKFLVVDMPEYDVVLGLDFLSKHDPIVHWRKRKLSINVKGKTVMLNAYQEPELPNIQSDTIEFCNIDTFSRSCGSDSRIDIANACVGCLLPEDLPNIDNELLKGKGASHHRIAPLLSDYADVLRDKIPEGLPPERFAADGTPIEHVIEVAEGEKPYARNARPFTREEDEEVQRYLKEFMENGWIRPSLSPWAAPVLFVPKKPDPVTGKRSWRMCISYVALNSKTLNRIAYRLPRISELLSRISTAKYFSKMDLLSGFYQVRVRGNDIEKTAFTTPHGNFEFKVMPMGLCGAPSTFQYLMDNTFRNPVVLGNGSTVDFSKFIAVYLDDICIFSHTEEEHLFHLRAVLQRLREHKLYVKPSKCEWLQTTIEFLGHMVNGTGQFINPERATALQNWPVPDNVPAIRSLLGTFGFWRDYVASYAHIVTPLTNLLKKDVLWKWRDNVEGAALRHLKAAITAAPVLARPDPDSPFFVVTDASDYAVGASLELNTDTGRRPVAFFSHRLSDQERKYPVHERELFAIVLALRVWRHHLYGSNFTVACSTDHRPLQHFMKQSNLSPRQVRWQQYLSEYNLEVHYVPGSTNTFADGLSRRPDLRLMLISAFIPYDNVLSEIKDGLHQTPEGKRMISKGRAKCNNDFSYCHGLVYYVHNSAHRIYVPDYHGLRSKLLHDFHDLEVAGHFGWNKTYHALAQHYNWPDMSTAVQDYVRRCPVCQRSKASKQPKPDLHPLPTPRRPFSWITLDWVSALPKSKGGNDGYLAIIDRFSKWAIVIPCTKHMSTAQLIELLYDKVFSWVGLPDCILGDRDSRLTADRIKRVMRSISVRLFHSTAYHPQTDGQTENFHRTFLSMLRAFVSKHQDDWEELVPSMLYAYHNTIHSATGFTPHKLLFGWSPRDLRAPMHNLPESDDPDFDFWLKERGSMLAKGQASIEHARQAMIDAHKSAPNAPQFKVNDLVKLSSAFLRVRCTGKQVRKLLPKFVGPFTVLGVVGPNAYQIKLPDAYSGIHNVINVSYLRPYFPDPDREFEPDLPPIELHPTFNPVVQILDRRRHGRAPRDLQSHLDIPTQYLVIRKDGTTLWQPQSALQAPEERQLIKRFELKFPRSDAKPCEPISAYITKETTEEELDSDDEVDLMLAQELEDRFGHE